MNQNRSRYQIILRLSLLAVTSLVVTGCAETGRRSLLVKNHQFEPSAIRVPANLQFALTIDGIDDRSLLLSSPELGLTALRIPVTQDDMSPIITTRPLSQLQTRLSLGPLKPAKYVIKCECHGNPSEAAIIAE